MCFLIPYLITMHAWPAAFLSCFSTECYVMNAKQESLSVKIYMVK